MIYKKSAFFSESNNQNRQLIKFFEDDNVYEIKLCSQVKIWVI